jgi:4-azaleucine resistance transporter AzlC
VGETSRQREFLDGARAQLPLLLGVAPFGMAYGAYAVERGIGAGLAQAMSVIIFGGASQFVAVELLATGVPGLVIVLTVGLVNLRHTLYAAALAPHVAPLSLGWRALLAYLLTDEAYAVGIRRYEQGDRAPFRHWYLLGTCMALWACWQVTTAAGVFVGAAVPDGWSLDFALPLTFIAIVVPALRDRPALAAAVAAGLIATIAFRWPYGTGLVTAAIAGLVAGVTLDPMLGAPPAAAAREPL